MTTIREFLDVTDQVIKTPQDVSYIVDCGGTAAASVSITLKEQVQGNFVGANVSLEFVDGAAGDDTLTRNRGSWIDDGFGIGQTLTITNTVSNNFATYVITAIDALTLTFATGTVAAEVVAGDAVVIVGDIAVADFVVYETIAAGLKKFTYVEGSGTGLRFLKTGGTGTIRVWVQS